MIMNNVPEAKLLPNRIDELSPRKRKNLLDKLIGKIFSGFELTEVEKRAVEILAEKERIDMAFLSRVGPDFSDILNKSLFRKLSLWERFLNFLGIKSVLTSNKLDELWNKRPDSLKSDGPYRMPKDLARELSRKGSCQLVDGDRYYFQRKLNAKLIDSFLNGKKLNARPS